MLRSVLHNYAFNLSYTQMLYGDLPDERMAEQPAGIANHPAWTLGHLVVASTFGVRLAGGQPELPEGWMEKFGRGSTPTGDRAAYPSKAEMLGGLEALHEQVSTALANADPALLRQPTPDEEFRQLMPTIGDGLTYLLVSHEATHLGQICAWRRAIGLPSVLG